MAENSIFRGMEHQSHPRILYNCYVDDTVEGETFVPDHVFSYIVSGMQDIWIGDRLYVFKAGDYRFFRKNQLTKYVKRSSGEGFKSITVHLDRATLQSLSEEQGPAAQFPVLTDNVVLLKPNRYLEQYIDSLTPYLATGGEMNEKIRQLKARELVLILLQTLPGLKNVLFDFSEPGKIDLEAFMNKHYRYNAGLDRFAFLSGRSLSGFKRDFEKLFHTTPGRWLVQKRLQEAHFLIEEKGKRPSEVYLDLGFSDLSHFSFAYKKAFGAAPTKGVKAIPHGRDFSA